MATADDRPGGLEKRLIGCLEHLIDEGFPEGREPVASVRAAIGALGECRRAMRAATSSLMPFVGESGGYQMCRACHAEQFSGLPIVHRKGCVMPGIEAALAKLGEGG